ncbi:hypothetical protein Ancab_006200 [Ancistrocladus abbreviatus]
MGRPPCCDKANVKRGLWTAEEDAKILACVSNHGIGNWTLVPKKAGLNRCGKSCRLRWTNYLRPDLKHNSFTPQEEQVIIQLHKAIGSRSNDTDMLCAYRLNWYRWSLIAKQLPGRTDNDVKNYWNTKLKKKLSKMGIDPVTHKPFSQILSDYENISCLPNTHQIQSPSLEPSSQFTSCSMGNAPLTDAQFPVKCSMDYLSQLEFASQQNSLDEVSPSSSSSSSASITMAQTSPAPIMPSAASYAWSELLLGEPPSQIPKTGVEDDKPDASDYEVSTVETEVSNSCEPSSLITSFVKEILDRDIQIQQDFATFNEILDY